MARYFASQGIRWIYGSNNSDNNLRHSPFLILFGPSGQACQVHGPSGYGLDPTTYKLQAYEQSFNHKPLTWYKNSIITSYRGFYSSTEPYPLEWSPASQTEGAKINANLYTPFSNCSLSNKVMLDGYNWKMWCHRIFGAKTQMGFLNLSDKALWVTPVADASLLQTHLYGLYDGSEPKYRPDSSARSGYWPNPGVYGKFSSVASANYSTGAGTSSSLHAIDGVRSEGDSNISPNICDMIEHNGTIYVAGQYYLAAFQPGGKGNWIYHDLCDDQYIDDMTASAAYTSRVTQGQYNTTSKCFAKHNGTLYMLSSDGKVYVVTPARITEVADITEIGTPWASGIVYGSCPRTQASDVWGGTNGRRCFLASFNGQLHAFLNFSSAYKKSRGTGKGVFWGTSFDGLTWSDRSELLPSSGVIPSSGTSTIHLTGWRNETYPYKFSGKTGSYLANNYTIWQMLASGYNSGQPKWGKKCQPSGFRQHGPLPFWSSSGTMIDVAGTAYNSLSAPLSIGAISGQLFPTWTVFPQGFQIISGEFRPYGRSASGWDYTDCDNYHIAGYNDNDRKRLCLIFSQDFHGGTLTLHRGRTLYYELTPNSGWIQRNYLPHANQMNGFVPIELFEPEVLIPSGTIYNPNPRVDEVNRSVSIDYNVYDWPYWGNVTVTGEYKIDEARWVQFYRASNISTGTAASDPSGVIGTKHTATWNYGPALGKNTEYNNVQVRFRAEAT